jgi:rod shape determining protein RodA
MTTTLSPIKERRNLVGLKRHTSTPHQNIDWVLMLVTGALIVVGMACIYSASSPWLTFNGHPATAYLQRQVVFLIAAVTGMAIVMAIDYEWLRARAAWLYVGTLLALMLVLVLGTGPKGSGAHAWFSIGPVLIQPAEFSKVTVLVLAAGYLAQEGRDGPRELTYTRFVTGLLFIGGPVGLILLQPDFGTASVLIAMAMGILLIAGAHARYILFITLLAIVTVTAMTYSGVVRSYQVERLTSFVNTDAKDKTGAYLNLQQRRAQQAIAIGGLTGKGWLKGKVTNGREVGEQWTDFAFTAWAEQFGLLGSIALILLYAAMLFRIWRIARLARDNLGLYICTGAMAMIIWHVFENIGMCLGIMPVTGIPLPLVSYGGSSAVTFLALIGLVQNVHMRRLR